MAVFGIIYRDRDPSGRITKIQADSYTFTSNQEWIEFWDGGGQARLTVKAPEVLSILTLDDNEAIAAMLGDAERPGGAVRDPDADRLRAVGLA